MEHFEELMRSKKSMVQLILCGVVFCYSSFGEEVKYPVERLPEYEALFTRDKGWTGADGVFSLELSDNKILWLFSDTWIGDIVDSQHKNATIVNNSIAIQRGKDPSNATVEFFWGTTQDGKPAAFITPCDDVGWFWIFHGVVADGKLYLFLMQMIKTDEKSVFGFKNIGTWLGEVENPKDEPTKWRIKQHKVPYGRYSQGSEMFFGSAVMKEGDFVYIYGCCEDRSKSLGGRRMVVTRAPHNGMTDFKKWRFWNGNDWVADANKVGRLFDGIATEYSVSFQPAMKKYVVIYTELGMSANIMMRVSDTPVGPWGQPSKVYECPEYNWHKTYFCYAAKGHQEISKEDELIITYVCNSTDFWQMARDARIYFPRFLRIKFDVQGHR